MGTKKFKEDIWTQNGRWGMAKRMNKDPTIINEIKSGRLRWAGHFERSMEVSLLKKDIQGALKFPLQTSRTCRGD